MLLSGNLSKLLDIYLSLVHYINDDLIYLPFFAEEQMDNRGMGMPSEPWPATHPLWGPGGFALGGLIEDPTLSGLLDSQNCALKSTPAGGGGLSMRRHSTDTSFFHTEVRRNVYCCCCLTPLPASTDWVGGRARPRLLPTGDVVWGACVCVCLCGGRRARRGYGPGRHSGRVPRRGQGCGRLFVHLLLAGVPRHHVEAPPRAGEMYIGLIGALIITTLLKRACVFLCNSITIHQYSL